MRTRAGTLSLAVALICGAALTGCSTATDVRDTPAAPNPTTSLGNGAAATEKCADGVSRTASFSQSGDKSKGLVADIVRRGRLVVGVSADSYLLGALKPGSVTAFDGFDIAVAREVAKDLLGDPNKIQFKVIAAADRPNAVNAGVDKKGVDLVARNYTMTCDRWKVVDFSATYFEAAQDTLVPASAPEKTLKQLGQEKKTVCAPKDSTSLNALPRLAPGAIPYGADQHTACLALLQEGLVDAITGDNTVLAGLRAQDPQTKVLGESLTSEPYGLATAKAHPELAQFVNSVLARIIRDGTWQRLYDKYFKDALGAAGPPTLDTSKPLP